MSTNDFLSRKTRAEALNDRINEARVYLNDLLPDDAGEQPVSSQAAINVITKMENMIAEINELEEVSKKTDANAIAKEIESLGSRSIVTMGISKVVICDKNLKMKQELLEKDQYIKRIEEEMLQQRLELESVKKKENEKMVKISTLEDQIRILKSKAFGFDVAKKYEYYKEHSKGGNVSNVEDQNLAYAMWEKENYGSRKQPPRLEKLEQSKQMWLKDSKNRVEQIVKDIDNANSYNNVNEANYNYPSNRQYASLFNKYNRENSQTNIGTNMRQYSNLILGNNNPKY